MNDKYCLPVIKTSLSEIAATIEANEPNYAYFEIWLDYIDGLSTDAIAGLIEKYPGRIVLVFRRKNLDPINTAFAKRSEILNKVSGLDCFVDLDISCQQEDLSLVAENNLQIVKIVSFHDYEQTPTDDELNTKVAEVKSHNPQILKISTLCQSKKDALRLLGLQLDLIEQDQKHIVLGMGENGLVTRVFATLWGNEMAFVPQTAEDESAKGQLPRDKFDKIMKELTS